MIDVQLRSFPSSLIVSGIADAANEAIRFADMELDAWEIARCAAGIRHVKFSRRFGVELLIPEGFELRRQQVTSSR